MTWITNPDNIFRRHVSHCNLNGIFMVGGPGGTREMLILLRFFSGYPCIRSTVSYSATCGVMSDLPSYTGGMK